MKCEICGKFIWWPFQGFGCYVWPDGRYYKVERFEVNGTEQDIYHDSWAHNKCKRKGKKK